MNIKDKLECVEFGRLQYSSSWDRGLDNLLYMLPFIRDRCPKITLHIYYGISGWINAAGSRNDKAALDLIDNLQKQIESMSEFVFVHDRINQLELSLEWRKAWLWLYPTNFTETFCITAKEAQYSATPIVCSDIAALKTTVGNAGMQIPFPYSLEARRTFIDETIKLYNNKEYWIEKAEQSLSCSIDSDWKSTYDKYWKSFI